MGDDVTIIVPEPALEPETELFDHERIGEELLTLIAELTAKNEGLNARIIALEERCAQLEGRDLTTEFATVGHEHDFAPTEHEHDGYAPTEHEHQKPQKERDRPPEAIHPYFRRIGD